MTEKNALHLSVSIRSFRAEALSQFIGAVIDNQPDFARIQFEKISDRYPINVTRDLATARQWLRDKARGSERYGMIASSGAHRLRAEGLFVRAKIDPKIWFLNDKSDVRSSFYLEEVATEFDVQGLELDWSCVCWDADYRYVSGDWGLYHFKGSKWQSVRDDFRRRYLKNAYRAILTRARQGFVIFVPRGDDRDPTRPAKFYDETFKYLVSCGIKEL